MTISSRVLPVVLFLSLASLAVADDTTILPDDLTVVGLDKVLNFNIEVTSPQKKPERYGNVASALFIITQEDIRRSGANHVAELLRMVPGLDVGRISANKWAISSRGFNAQYATKLLVLLDGRTIFTPLFNGVYWELNELVLEDIERI